MMSQSQPQSRYRHGKIYKIVSNKTGLVYIGSTCKTLPQRIAQHERDYKQYLKTGKKYNVYMTSFKILKHGNYQIQLVENVPCKNSKELHAREKYWIEKTNCVVVWKIGFSDL